MIVGRDIVKTFGKLVSRAEKRAIEGIKDGRTETEPSITDRFLNEVERSFEEYEGPKDIVFRARTLRDMGPKAPEREFGADFCGVLDIRLSSFAQRKGFLSQAKRDGHGVSVKPNFRGLTPVSFLRGAEWQRLQRQLDKMLQVTPDSFVFVYGTGGFTVVPASSIKGLKTRGELYGKPVDRFFKEYLMCFIGDPQLTAYDDASLEDLRRRGNARAAVLLQILEES